MDIKTSLKQYRHMVREIRDLEIRVKAYEISACDTMDAVRGGYGGTQRFDVCGQTDAKVTKEKSRYQIDMLRKAQLIRRMDEQKTAVEAYIDQIKDSRMRLIMRYRYIDGMSWGDVAQSIGEAGQGDAVRVAADRFIRLQKKFSKK